MKRFFYSFIGLLVYWFIGLLAFSLTALPARAQENWVDSDYARCLEAAEGGEVCKSAYASSVQSDLQADMVRKILGPVPGVTVTADAWQRNPEYVRKMAVGAAVPQIGNFIAMMYANPPADLALWIRDTGESLGFIPKQAYAQGIGFSGLAPLLPIWKAFRNIAYFLLAIVLVIIGFMVMLRKKIDPKTVVTVQNALPKIVVTLLLITFSYAIAGFIIDLMYLSIAVIANILVNASGGLLGSDTASKYISGGLGTVGGALFGGGWSSIEDLMKLLIGKAGTYSGGPLTGEFWLTLAADVATLGSRWVFITLIVAIAILFGYVRIIFMLISAYINIVLSVLTAPLQLLVEAIPGNNSFAAWITNLFANTIVFPITAALLLVGTILARSNPDTLWTPPLLSGEGRGGILGIVALGVLMIIPTVVGQIKESLKVKPPVAAGLGAIFGPVGAGVGQAFQLGYQGMFIASPFLHKTPPSTPLGRSMEAIEGKVDAIAKHLGLGGRHGSS